MKQDKNILTAWAAVVTAIREGRISKQSVEDTIAIFSRSPKYIELTNKALEITLTTQEKADAKMISAVKWLIVAAFEVGKIVGGNQLVTVRQEIGIDRTEDRE